MLAACPHFDLAVLHQRPAELDQALIQIFARYHEPLARRQGLDRQAPVLELCEHFLDRADFIDDIEVILFVHVLLKRARELLHRVD